jgi:regulator of RNase E activity RraA
MVLKPDVLAALGGFTTPSVLNGLKRLGQRPEQLRVFDRNVLRSMSPGLGIRVGYAATVKVQTAGSGAASGVEHDPELTRRQNEQLLAEPRPRILVVENVGEPEGPACLWGEVMANIYTALGCHAGVTNGPVRDLPEMEAVGFATFASGLAVGGGFVRTLEVGAPVTVAGVTVHSGDLIHADQHGVLKVPLELAEELPAAVAAVEAFEQRVIAVTRAPDFSLDKLAEAWKGGRH